MKIFGLNITTTAKYEQTIAGRRWFGKDIGCGNALLHSR